MRPLVLIHGYSATGLDFEPLRQILCQKLDRKPIDINIANYVSLNNEITIKDIAEGLDRAFRFHDTLKNDSEPFDAIVHSTGMLVIRSWLANHGGPVTENKRLKRLKHLIGLAPATWGSPQAHKGRTWLGALVKGNRQWGPDFLNAGDMVLDGLELGGAFTWDLAHLDLLGEAPYYDSGPDTPFVTVFIGNKHYDGIAEIAVEPGTDGTVRWAGCGLNTRKIKLNLTRHATADGSASGRVTLSKWADARLDIPMIAVNDRNHGTIVSDPEDQMTDLIVKFLKVGEEGGQTYNDWLQEAKEYSDQSIGAMKMDRGADAAGIVGAAKEEIGKLLHLKGRQIEGWQQFVIRCVDERGDGVPDYVIEVSRTPPGDEFTPFAEMYQDVHAYGKDRSYRCFHIQLPEGISDPQTPLRIRIHASTGTKLLAYQGYGDDNGQTVTEDSQPIELNLANFSKLGGTLFFPFTTTLVEIVLNREPVPFGKISDILTWLPVALSNG